jgi:hypothetical protein
MSHGSNRFDRQFLDPAVIHKIRRFSSLGTEPFEGKEGGFSWEITISIPISVFIHHEIQDLSGKTFHANLYKCGDKLPTRHYLLWNPVALTPKPDFHQIKGFGEIEFK